jgi:hypothetical protein
MPGFRFQPDAVYEPASPGTRVRVATLLAFVVVVLSLATVSVAMLRERQPAPWPVFFLPPGILVLFVVIWHGARVRRYRLTADDLQVERAFQTVRSALAGLQSVTSDPLAIRGALKVAGNDGLGAVAGRFRSKHLGPFRAYVTDAEHAVVLRWPDRCLVISPQQHSLFVETVRKRAGLSRSF